MLLQRAERAAFANNIKTQATCCKGLCPCSNRYRSSDLGEPDLVIYCDEPKVRTSSERLDLPGIDILNPDDQVMELMLSFRNTIHRAELAVTPPLELVCSYCMGKFNSLRR